MDLIFVIISGYVLAGTVPWLQRSPNIYRLFPLLPFALSIYFSTLLPGVLDGDTISVSVPWVPSLGIALSFHIDGLSLLFTLLISGIGSLILLYAGSYLKGHPNAARFYICMLAFMSSMLGLVLADNIISLFVFWELTGITSYLLIGFNHTRERARHAALQALLVTGTGGLALLAGLVMLGTFSGSMELSEILSQPNSLKEHAFYLPVLMLVLTGAFTKSAQFPFHFWLPNAMEAPTPVSAYLHSATMVQAGIYLLARLNPLLGGTDAWYYALAGFGAVTMVAGALTALRQSDMKRILAYSTVSVLGMLTMLLGIGTDLAIKAAMVLLLAHALYKAALFLIAGSIEHGTGTRDATLLSGLGRAMPVTALSGMVAALSMAGIPPAFGFIAKETFYEAATHSTEALALTALTVVASAALVAVSITVAIRPFWGKLSLTANVHEVSPSLWFGPTILAGLGLFMGLTLTGAGHLLSSAASAVKGQELAVKLAFWHGPNVEILLSAATLVAGVAVYRASKHLTNYLDPALWVFRAMPEILYSYVVNGMLRVAKIQTRILQNGRLRTYLMTILLFTVALIGYTLIRFHGIPSVQGGFAAPIHEYLIAGAILVSVLVVVSLSSLLSAIVVMGVIGYGTALIYVLFGAPDLAMTQFIVETLTMVLFVLGFYHLPQTVKNLRRGRTLGNALVAIAAGTVVTILVLVSTSSPSSSRLSTYFAENSYLLADGRNIVNVILVDFRALDTLGEIVVLGIAAIGVIALLKLRHGQKKEIR